jgi:hypothetical protein
VGVFSGCPDRLGYNYAAYSLVRGGERAVAGVGAVVSNNLFWDSVRDILLVALAAGLIFLIWFQVVEMVLREWGVPLL